MFRNLYYGWQTYKSPQSCERLTAECTLTGVLLKRKYWVTSDKMTRLIKHLNRK